MVDTHHAYISELPYSRQISPASGSGHTGRSRLSPHRHTEILLEVSTSMLSTDLGMGAITSRMVALRWCCSGTR
jgi:hypothetical protein